MRKSNTVIAPGKHYLLIKSFNSRWDGKSVCPFIFWSNCFDIIYIDGFGEYHPLHPGQMKADQRESDQ